MSCTYESTGHKGGFAMIWLGKNKCKTNSQIKVEQKSILTLKTTAS